MNILGIAKGAGMIHPQLATMLVYLFTDAVCQSNRAKTRCCQRSASRPSTASRLTETPRPTIPCYCWPAARAEFRLKQPSVRKDSPQALLQVCQSLAEQIVSDGEGVKHVIRLSVEQASNREEARQVAQTVAHSLLVKTAWAGADPNWGRILAAVGRSGIALDAAKVTIEIGDQTVCRGGVGCAFDEKRAHQALAQPRCDIRIVLGRGGSTIQFLTTDLTSEYVSINADYST